MGLNRPALVQRLQGKVGVNRSGVNRSGVTLPGDIFDLGWVCKQGCRLAGAGLCCPFFALCRLVY